MSTPPAATKDMWMPDTDVDQLTYKHLVAVVTYCSGEKLSLARVQPSVKQREVLDEISLSEKRRRAKRRQSKSESKEEDV